MTDYFPLVLSDTLVLVLAIDVGRQVLLPLEL